MEKTRLQKYLADCGITSRRKAELLIMQGKVKINDRVVKELGTKVYPNDKVEFKGEIIEPKQEKVYIMLNKPVGYLSTVKKGKEKGKTVLDLIDTAERVFPVGRLDKNSSGLLILTNDGDLALKLTHPRYQKEKEYEVEVNKSITKNFLNNMRRGVSLAGKKSARAEVEQTGPQKFNIILKEGKKRQIRRMCDKLGYEVKSLRRIRINDLKLGNLKSGGYRFLNANEIKALK